VCVCVCVCVHNLATFSEIQADLEQRVQKSREDRDREVRFYAYYPLRNPSDFKRNPQQNDTEILMAAGILV
jgi:hypothetical protein